MKNTILFIALLSSFGLCFSQLAPTSAPLSSSSSSSLPELASIMETPSPEITPGNNDTVVLMLNSTDSLLMRIEKEVLPRLAAMIKAEFDKEEAGETVAMEKAAMEETANQEEEMMKEENMTQMAETEKVEVVQQPEEETTESATGSFAVNILHNSFAGIHPAIFGSIPTKKGPTITYYGVFWSNPAFGNPASGNDFWFEHGAGVAFTAFKQKLLINPSLGFAHGKLLSGHESTVVGDGIIPSVFMHYGSGRLAVDFYFAYYKALRQGPNASTDFIFNWVNPLIQVNKFFSIGAYYEQFVNTRTAEVKSPTSINQWLGGSIKFSAGNGPSLMIAVGKNFSDIGGREFHKISASFPIR
ncbi:MAG: DUF6733 family protein [Bacteroidota bacterium]